MMTNKMTRAQLEAAIVEYQILPGATLGTMTDAELLAAVNAWIDAGDECADC